MFVASLVTKKTNKKQQQQQKPLTLALHLYETMEKESLTVILKF